MLQLQDITKSFAAGHGGCSAAVRVLDGVCLTISARQVVVLSGPRGSGKTTLLQCAAGLLHADSGELRTLTGMAARIHYWPEPHDWRRAAPRDAVPHAAIHLFDGPDFGGYPGARTEFAAVLRRLSVAGQSVLIATSAPLHDFVALVPRGTRYYQLHRGRLAAALLPPAHAVAMVAERRAPAFG